MSADHFTNRRGDLRGESLRQTAQSLDVSRQLWLMKPV